MNKYNERLLAEILILCEGLMETIIAYQEHIKQTTFPLGLFGFV